jgi:NAD-dependent deacetylase
MILALTGAGISASSGIPTFQSQPGIRDKLTRTYARRHPEKYQEVIDNMQSACDNARPNDAHLALAEYDIPIITMNIDGLHQRAGSNHVLPIHGTLPNIVLYEDPAPLYSTAMDWVDNLRPSDFLLIIGTSFYTSISERLRLMALAAGADVYLINEDAEHKVREFLQKADTPKVSFEDFMARGEE